MAGKQTKQSVAVLGAGIMGSSVALYLAKKKIPVVLIDAGTEPFTGASRWNEGKIHLGYLYGADPSLNTARKLIPGGLIFPQLIKELTGRDLDDELVTPANDRYLIHKNSIVTPDDMFSVAQKISALTREHPDADKYFTPLSESRPRRLSAREIADDYNTEIIQSAIEVPEHSVSTNHIADYFLDALAGSPYIESFFGCRVTAVEAHDSHKNQWKVKFHDSSGNEETIGPFSAVVNALWEGRKQIDATVGLDTSGVWTNRYRLSLFAKLRNTIDLKSAVVAVGPFGDVKNYNGKDLYLSWYNEGLLAESHALIPPSIHLPNRQQELQIVRNKLENLAQVIPEIKNLFKDFAEFKLKGGWVYAEGKGSLSDSKSELHQRSRIGTYSRKGYFSVDTGKYSVAPWLAREVAKNIESLIF